MRKHLQTGWLKNIYFTSFSFCFIFSYFQKLAETIIYYVQVSSSSGNSWQRYMLNTEPSHPNQPHSSMHSFPAPFILLAITSEILPSVKTDTNHFVCGSDGWSSLRWIPWKLSPAVAGHPPISISYAAACTIAGSHSKWQRGHNQ